MSRVLMPLEESLLFQPEFKWANHTSTQQGTGSFIKAPNGSVVALTSAHFIDFSGPQLLEVTCLDLRTEKAIASSVRSWGMPGKEGSYSPLDLRSDYLLFVIENDTFQYSTLEIDERNGPTIFERVWFPNKNPKTPLGYDPVEGTVTISENTHILVILDNVIELQSRSGTPVISHETGKVIGILTGGNEQDNKTILCLAPASGIGKALMETKNYPLLHQVIGQVK